MKEGALSVWQCFFEEFIYKQETKGGWLNWYMKSHRTAGH